MSMENCNMKMESRNMNNSRGCRNERTEKELMDIITKVSFAMDDTRLYLDTHPDCPEALEYFKKMQNLRHEAVREYTEKFGQIMSYHAGSCDDWNWNSAPLPWHSGKKGGC